MDAYQRAFGGGLRDAAGTIPTIATKVPLSQRFGQIHLSQAHSIAHAQRQFPFDSQNQADLRMTPAGAGYMGYGYSNSSVAQRIFPTGPSYDNYNPEAVAAQAVRNRMISRQLAQRRAALELQELRAMVGTSAAHMRGHRGLRASGMSRLEVMRNQLSAMSSRGFSRGRGVSRGGFANRVKSPAVPRVGLGGRVGNANRISARGANTISTRGGRGRNFISMRGGRGDFNKRNDGTSGNELPTKEDLDSELDLYMSNCKTHLDKELDDYMKSNPKASANSSVASADANQTETPATAEVAMEV